MAALHEIFAANRAFGRITFSAKASAGLTRRSHLREEGPLRLRCPGAPSAELEAVIVNTAGGVVSGDRSRARRYGCTRSARSSSPPQQQKKSIVASQPDSDHCGAFERRGRQLARLAAAGNDIVRWGAAFPHDPCRCRRGCPAYPRRSCRIRPGRHGRNRPPGTVARSLAHSSCRTHPPC